jgi:hypothetical protein
MTCRRPTWRDQHGIFQKPVALKRSDSIGEAANVETPRGASLEAGKTAHLPRSLDGVWQVGLRARRAVSDEGRGFSASETPHGCPASTRFEGWRQLELRDPVSC